MPQKPRGNAGRHAFGQLTLHPERNGASILIHVGSLDGAGNIQWGGDQNVEMRWKADAEKPDRLSVEKVLGAEDYASFMRILEKLRQGSHSSVKDLQDSTFVAHEA